MTLLAIVPAKYDSARLPGKNRMDIGGRSLVQHTIDYLQACRMSGIRLHIVLATDSEEMLNHAEGFDHVVISPARGRAVLDVKAAFDKYFRGHLAVGMFLPTSPLRKVSYLNQCVNHILHDYDGAITVTPFDFPPQLAIPGYGIKGLDLHFPLQYATDDTRTQDQQVYYRPNGMCYVTRSILFHRHGNFFTGKVRGVLVPRSDMVDIDYQEDMDIARARMETWSIV
jgi:CMP-N-acetylneuraminic acid synthetase